MRHPFIIVPILLTAFSCSEPPAPKPSTTPVPACCETEPGAVHHRHQPIEPLSELEKRDIDSKLEEAQKELLPHTEYQKP